MERWSRLCIHFVLSIHLGIWCRGQFPLATSATGSTACWLLSSANIRAYSDVPGIQRRFSAVLEQPEPWCGSMLGEKQFAPLASICRATVAHDRFAHSGWWGTLHSSWEPLVQNWRTIACDDSGFGESLDGESVIADVKWLALEPRLVVVPVRSGMQHRGVWHWNWGWKWIRIGEMSCQGHKLWRSYLICWISGSQALKAGLQMMWIAVLAYRYICRIWRSITTRRQPLMTLSPILSMTWE